MDLDVVFYDALAHDFRPGLDLVLPHERSHERDFVLGPVCDICEPDMAHPIQGGGWLEGVVRVASLGWWLLYGRPWTAALATLSSHPTAPGRHPNGRATRPAEGPTGY